MFATSYIRLICFFYPLHRFDGTPVDLSSRARMAGEESAFPVVAFPIVVAGCLVALVRVGLIEDSVENPWPLYRRLDAVFLASVFALGWVNERLWVTRAGSGTDA